MTVYNPAAAALVNGDPFAGAVMDGSFDALSTAINAAVNDTSNLVTNGDLTSFKFHDGAVSETFTTNSVGKMPEAFNVIADNAAPWGTSQNLYDVVDAAVDFYLYEQADCRFEGCAELARGKDWWNSTIYGGVTEPNSFTFEVKLIIDGVEERDLRWGYEPASLKEEMRGFPMDISFTKLAMPAGRHSAHLRLLCSSLLDKAAWLAGGAPLPMLTQFVSNYRFLSVHAIYL